jgi:hypothetical protein
MILRVNVNHFLIEHLALRVLNPKYELDRAWVSISTTYKSNKLYVDIFLGILVSK